MEKQIGSLLDEIYHLDYKLNYYDNAYRRAKRDYDSCVINYDTALRNLRGTYIQGFSGITFQHLVESGKLVIDQSGCYVLNNGAKVPTVYTERVVHDIEYTSYRPDTGRVMRCVGYRGTGLSDDYTVVHERKEKVVHEDVLFNKAKDWVNSNGYVNKRKAVITTYNQLCSAQLNLLEIENKAVLYKRSPEYIRMCMDYQSKKEELAILQRG